MDVVRSFVNYAIFRELCDRMRFEVGCAKSHHRVISEGLILFQLIFMERSSTIAHSWIYRTLVAHLVVHRAETREVVSSRLRPDVHSGSLNN